MSNKFIFPIAYSIGVVCGILCTRKYFRDKYEGIAQEEIASVKEVQNRRQAEKKATELDEYKTRLQKEGYLPNEDEKGTNEIDIPYVISPEEFANNEEYDNITLTYYSDGVLTDENDEIIENVDDIVGEDSLHHFGEYEDDSVYVKNDRRHCVYEILLDNGKYSDVYREMPHQKEY